MLITRFPRFRGWNALPLHVGTFLLYLFEIGAVDRLEHSQHTSAALTVNENYDPGAPLSALPWSLAASETAHRLDVRKGPRLLLRRAGGLLILGAAQT